MSRRHWAASAWVDGAIATALAGGVFVLHPLSYVFHHPFWLDEAWVATLAKAPFSRAMALSSSTPIGWLLLVRAIPGGRGEQARLIPLLFAAAGVAAAYVVARDLPWGSKWFARAAGAAAGLAVLFAPVSLVRNDLKQYTADVFFALVILALANRAEGAPGTRTMIDLAVGSVIAVFFSTAAAFVVVAVFVGLLGAAVASRSVPRVRIVAAYAVGVAAAVVGYFALVVVPHTNPALRSYWDDFYLPSSPLSALSEVWHRFEALAPAIGMSALVAVALFGAGCVALARIGRPALAAALVVLWIEMIVVAMARRYPLLDLRTSQFLLVLSMVAIVIGMLGFVHALMASWRLLVIAIAVVTAATYLEACVPYVRARWIPSEDVRSATTYVARHRRAGDIVVVTLPSNYGFGYYWPGGRIQYVTDDAISMGFVTRVRGLHDVEYVDGTAVSDTTRALRKALDHVGRAATSRVWIIRSHLLPDEAQAWEQTFDRLGLHPVLRQVGSEPIWILSGAQR